jgi:hypothetical protein
MVTPVARRVGRILFPLALAAGPFLVSCSGGGGGGGGRLALVSAQAESGAVLGTTRLHLNERIVLQFSSPVDRLSLTQDAIRIRRRPAQSGPYTIPAQGSFVVRGSTVSFVPLLPTRSDLSDAGLREATTYEVLCPGFPSFDALRSTSGSPLAEDFVMTFTTRSEAPLLLDPTPGPPQVLAIGLDLDGDGRIKADGDPLTVESEEFFDLDSFPFLENAPVGLARAPLAVGLVLSEPVLPESVFQDVDGDGLPDAPALINISDGYRVPAEIRLIQRFLPAEDRLEVVLLFVPEATLPPGVRLRPFLGPGIADFASPPFFLQPFEAEFTTRVGPDTLLDAFVEEFKDRRRSDPFTTAEWGVGGSGVLTAGKGIGGTGADGSLVVPSDATEVLDTDVQAGVYNFTDIEIRSGATVFVIGSNPLRIFSRGDVTLRGTILLRGENGTNGRTGVLDSPGGAGGPGGHDGGNAGTSGFADGAVPMGGGQGGATAGSQAGGGGGAGHARPGATNFRSNCNAGRGGVTYGTPSIAPPLGGSGGGGGGHLFSGMAGDIAGGGGGGGGGGVILINCAGTFTLSGAIRADGGVGGRGGVGATGAFGGAGGGGGSGGAIKISAFAIAPIVEEGASLTAAGGTGGLAGVNPRSGGAGGSEGRIFIETFDTNRDDQPNDFVIDRNRAAIVPQENRGVLSEGNLGRSFALSRFLDTGTRTARFAFDASDPVTGRVRITPDVEDIVLRDSIPPNATVTIRFQGAHESPVTPRTPDLDTVTPFTSRIEELDGYTFLRYRIDFDIGREIDIAESPIIDRLQIRFAFDID